MLIGSIRMVYEVRMYRVSCTRSFRIHQSKKLPSSQLVKSHLAVGDFGSLVSDMCLFYIVEIIFQSCYLIKIKLKELALNASFPIALDIVVFSRI